MFPEYSYNPATPRNDGRRRQLLIIATGFILLVIVGIIILATRSSGNNTADPGYRLTATDLKADQNFSYARGNAVYAYNGLAFYKVTTDGSNTVTVLNAGLKLPTPSAVYWGETGALLSFKQSFIESQVYNILLSQGKSIDTETSNYVWYLDFASGKLSLASDVPISPDSVYYSSSSKGFYYTIQPGFKFVADTTPFYFYDVTKAASIQLSTSLGVINIRDPHSCSASSRLCFIANDTAVTSDRLYAYGQDGKLTQAYDSKGRLFATNRPDVYITVPGAKIASSRSTGISKDNDFDDFEQQAAQLYNLKDKQTSDLGFTVGQSNIFPYFTSDSDFYVFDDQYNVNADTGKNADLLPGYRSGSIDASSKAASKLFALKTADDKQFSGNITALSDGSDISLATDVTDNRQYVFGKPDAIKLTGANQNDVQQTVRGCISSGALSFIYLDTVRTFRITLTDDNTFAANIAKFSSCIVQKGGAAQLGYNYTFAGQDAVNGRLTTD